MEQSPPAAAGPRGDERRGAIDLPAFVAATIATETGGHGIDPCELPLPPEWRSGLDGLPGFDRAQGVLRTTRDRSCLRDAQGRTLAFLGRAHPVVRRACSGAQRGLTAEHDHRVSMARAESGLAVLLTFCAELRSQARIELQWIVAVLLPRGAPPTELPNPDSWLRFAARACGRPYGNTWHDLFADWATQRQSEAEAVALASMQGTTERFATERQRNGTRQAADIQAWLQGRANDICGPYTPRTADLFGTATGASDWQTLADPLQRLARVAADGANQPARRRDANAAIEIFQHRNAEIAARGCLSPATLRPIGMLMLVP
jgi:hypothetical protein